MIGQTLGHYRIIEKIGAGGMGVVYRASDQRLDRDVALKVLPLEMMTDRAAVRLFRQEAQALSKLNHPNIATVHDFDTHDGVTFLVMEYIPGTTLDHKIAAGPLPEKEVVRLGVQLAQGLQAAHCKGVVHRDLKPSNLRTTPDSRLKILDFGLARLTVAADPDATRSTLETHPEAGTIPYMSPEQLDGEPADERSDIYAAGAVLYEMATGQRLFPDKHGQRLIKAIQQQSPRSPRELNGQISAGLQNIILKALDKKSEHRYQSARELQVDLERLSLATPIPRSEAPAESSEFLPLEIAHVLFMDIVAYSKLPMDQQRQLIDELQKTVRGTLEYTRAKSADKLISLPSGDGMALVFFGDPEAPCRCALEVSRALRNHSETGLRMGIHTGPVYRVADINANRNVAGGGINMAQRVMDCGDSGHILVSKAVADVLTQVSCWSGSLHELGEAEVKHGERVHLFNLYTEEAGNPRAPKTLALTKVVHKSDSAKVVKARRSGSSQKDRNGAKAANEMEGQAVLPGPKEVKIPSAMNWMILAGVLALALLAAGLYWFHGRELATKEKPEVTASFAIPFTSFKGREVMPTFSPDGNQIAFAWDAGKDNNFDLYVKGVGTENVSRLTYKPSIWLAPAWSPDGRTIAFARKSASDSGIFEIAANGGPERKLASVVYTHATEMSLSWSRDGKLLTSDADQIARLLDRENGQLSILPRPAHCEAITSPMFSPDGKQIAFLDFRDSGFLLFVMRPDGTGARQLTANDMGSQRLAWSSDGKRVILTNPRTNQLMEVDVESGKQTSIVFSQDASQPTVAHGGHRLAYARSFENVNIWGTSPEPNIPEAHRMLVSSTRSQLAPDMSPDGKRITFESDRSGAREIWVADMEGGNEVQLTHFNRTLTGTPRWSPNGQLIAFDSRATGKAMVYLVDPDGGLPRPLSTKLNSDSIPSWSRDGKSIYVSVREHDKGEIYKVPVEGGDPKSIAKGTFIGNVKESEDGKWLYFANAGAETEIRVISSTGGEDHALAGMPKIKDMTDWALGKDGIFFLDRRAVPATIKLFDLRTEQIRQIATLNKLPAVWGGLSLSPDGKWLAYSQVDETPSDIMLVDHFQ